MKIFTYGTLKRGFINNYILGNSRFIKEDSISGATLYDTQCGYPAVFKNSKGVVKGEIHDINEETLEELDILESEGVLYNRVSGLTESGEKVQFYVYASELPTHFVEVKCGEWLNEVVVTY